ncbi:MAG: amylo-alpha-1,6-glucosidase [Acidobacteria bacterium]|nr:amylo-alpha-1,6-glucosidase [Acidobacteriota bacterium]
MIRFEQEICSNLEAASQREWLETNGLGGFASSTVAGLNTRRYHGLLVAATQPPVGRMVLLSKLEETLIIDGRRYDLSANQYPGAVHPQGYQYLKEFRLDPFPIFTYEVEGLEIEKSVFMIHGENSTVIQYEVRTTKTNLPDDLRLEVHPLIAFRDYHSTTHENGAINPQIDSEDGRASVTPYQGAPTLHLAHNAAELVVTGYWYRNFEYWVERDRGLDFKEDLFNPYILKFDVRNKAQAAIIASTGRDEISRVAMYRRAEIQRRANIIGALPCENELVSTLVAAADQYIVSRGEQKTIIAGYHWFGDWGRDTMIALPGLTLTTGRFDVAKSILLEFAQFVDRGMLPNRFPDAGEQPEYNTVDATLWYFESVRSFLQYTVDYNFVRANLYHLLTDIIDWHERGTRYGIRVDEDGLLHSGEPGVQLTWMDAKVGDWVVTPRNGKAVEIQALWYNALRVMEELGNEFGDEAGEKRYGQMAKSAKQSFNRLFWNEEAGCLFDVVDSETRDGSIRPNQILATSLQHTMLTIEKAKQVVAIVERELLTPYGLRSLAPGDAQYRGRYAGGPAERDGVYHQGTVWAWLMGPFITAYLKVNGSSEKAREQASQWLEAFNGHLNDAGLGQVSEVFDGDQPYHPGGCIAQAWSVAELLRAAAEDVYGLKPVKRKATVV